MLTLVECCLNPKCAMIIYGVTYCGLLFGTGLPEEVRHASDELTNVTVGQLHQALIFELAPLKDCSFTFLRRLLKMHRRCKCKVCVVKMLGIKND